MRISAPRLLAMPVGMLAALSLAAIPAADAEARVSISSKAIAAPAPPSALKIVAIGDRQITIDWRGSTSASRYHVYRNGERVAGPSRSQFTDRNLRKGKSYRYRVSAANPKGRSPLTAQVSGSPGSLRAKASAVTSVPTGLKVASVGDRRVELDWNDNSGSYGRYQVYRDDRLISNGPTSSRFIDTNVVNGKTYQYRISAGTSSGYSGWTTAVAATPSAAPVAPAIPTGLKVVSAADGTVALDWNDNTGSFGKYQIYRDDQLIANGPTESRYTATGLTNGKAYTFRISAGTDGNYGTWSTTVSATPKATPVAPPAPTPTPTPVAPAAPVAPAIPTGLEVVSAADGTVALDWNDNTGSFGKYQIYRDDQLIANGPTESRYTATGLTNGKAYTFRISAGTDGNYGTWSNTVSATPVAPVAPVESTETAPVSGQVIVAPDWRNVANNTQAASLSNPNLPALPGLKSTNWNIRAGGPFARIETVDGRKALRFHVPAGYKSDEGSVRAEQEFAMGVINPGTWVWVGFDIKTNDYSSLGTWNLGLQFKNNGKGSPPASLNIHGTKGTGLRLASDGGGENHLLHSNTTNWKRVVLGFYAAKRPLGQVHGFVDGAQVFADTSWTSFDSSSDGGAGWGSTIYDSRTSAYLKFGIYGGTSSSARDHYFANMVVATTRDAAMNSPHTD